jgi:hypothetical protein
MHRFRSTPLGQVTMTSIRRTALRALVGVAAAFLVGFVGVTATATAAPATQLSSATDAVPSDFIW